MVAGSTTEPRTATIGTTNSSAALTGASGTFQKGDVGRPISGTGIPAGATISAVASSTAATLSTTATATGSPTATIGGTGTVAQQLAAAQNYGFLGWNPETEAERDSYSVAANNAGTVQPDRITNTYTPVTRRTRG